MLSGWTPTYLSYVPIFCNAFIPFIAVVTSSISILFQSALCICSSCEPLGNVWSIRQIHWYTVWGWYSVAISPLLGCVCKQAMFYPCPERWLPAPGVVKMGRCWELHTCIRQLFKGGIRLKTLPSVINMKTLLIFLYCNKATVKTVRF